MLLINMLKTNMENDLFVLYPWVSRIPRKLP